MANNLPNIPPTPSKKLPQLPNILPKKLKFRLTNWSKTDVENRLKTSRKKLPEALPEKPDIAKTIEENKVQTGFLEQEDKLNDYF